MPNVILFGFIRSSNMSREKTHVRIEELLAALSLQNDRLSLHPENLSSLDIELLRSNCIKLYENILQLENSSIEVDTTALKKEDTNVAIPKFVPIVEPQEESALDETSGELETEPEAVKEQVQKEVNKVAKRHEPEEEMLSLFEKFSSKAIVSIPRAISVAKRFEFQTEFFEGDSTEYKNFMKSLDEAEGREEAFEIYHAFKEKLQWDNEDLKDELKALMYRKYQS